MQFQAVLVLIPSIRSKSQNHDLYRADHDTAAEGLNPFYQV